MKVDAVAVSRPEEFINELEAIEIGGGPADHQQRFGRRRVRTALFHVQNRLPLREEYGCDLPRQRATLQGQGPLSGPAEHPGAIMQTDGDPDIVVAREHAKELPQILVREGPHGAALTCAAQTLYSGILATGSRALMVSRLAGASSKCN